MLDFVPTEMFRLIISDTGDVVISLALNRLSPTYEWLVEESTIYKKNYTFLCLSSVIQKEEHLWLSVNYDRILNL